MCAKKLQQIDWICKNNKNMKNVKSLSMKQYEITQHKPGHLNFERCETIVVGIDYQWQCDLCDTQSLSADNNGYDFLLVNADVFSNSALAVLLKSKKIHSM